MKVTLIASTPDPERVVAAAAKTCYATASLDDLLDGLDDAETGRFVDMLAEIGHESPIEHASFTFAAEGISRSLLAQLTRHRIASYSVRSQRYVSEKRFTYVTPPEIADEPEALSVYREIMDADNTAYEKLVTILTARHLKTYQDEGRTDAKTLARRRAQEDARFVLPNACDTQLVFTMNARSLMNFFRHRCCARAQWEIRAFADAVLTLVREAAPRIFAHAGPPCVGGPCPEGKMSCGRSAEVRARYGG